MTEEVIGFYDYVHLLELALHTPEGDIIDLTEYLNVFEINNNYKEYNFPYMRAQLRSTRKIHLKVQQKSIDSIWVLNITTYKMDDTKDEKLSNGIPFNKEPLILRALDIPDFQPPHDQSEVAESSEEEIHGYKFLMNVYLIAEEHLLQNEKEEEFITHDSLMGDIVGGLVGRNASPNFPAIVSETMENGMFNISVPSLSFNNSLDYLQENFGVFPNGMETYTDLRNMLVLDSKDKDIQRDNTTSKLLINVYDHTDIDRLSYKKQATPATDPNLEDLTIINQDATTIKIVNRAKYQEMKDGGDNSFLGSSIFSQAVLSNIPGIGGTISKAIETVDAISSGDFDSVIQNGVELGLDYATGGAYSAVANTALGSKFTDKISGSIADSISSSSGVQSLSGNNKERTMMNDKQNEQSLVDMMKMSNEQTQNAHVFTNNVTLESFSMEVSVEMKWHTKEGKDFDGSYSVEAFVNVFKKRHELSKVMIGYHYVKLKL